MQRLGQKGSSIPEQEFERSDIVPRIRQGTKIRMIALITKRLIEANQGKIEVESREGEGATFYLKFPLPSEQIQRGKSN
ncbi:hypothetical protein ES703_52296 [subsurface metagenome]